MDKITEAHGDTKEAFSPEFRRIVAADFDEDQVVALERENKELHQQVILLRSGLSPELSTALARVSKTNELSTSLEAMRREVRRTRLLVMVAIVAYWFLVGGWLPL